MASIARILQIAALGFLHVKSQTIDLIIDDIRLVDGRTQHDGIVQLNVDGIWGTINSYNGNMDIMEGNVLCRMLNASGANEISTSQQWYTENRNNVTHYCGYRFYCNGSETSLSACKFIYFPSSYCPRDYDTALNCYYELDTHISNSHSMRFGPVTVFSNGTWHPICNEKIGMSEAKVVCRNLGFRGSAIMEKYRWPLGSLTSTYNGSFSCNGTEMSLKYCHQINETVSCEVGNFFAVKCLDIDITGVRLANGVRPYVGIVEIQINGTWGTICGENGFDENAANVLCRMMNYTSSKRFYYTTQVLGPSAWPIYFSRLICKGTETTVAECSYERSNTCRYYYAVTMECRRYFDVEIGSDVRVNTNGSWLTVCSDAINHGFANVSCTSLGYSGIASFNTSQISVYSSSYPLYPNSINCKGSESRMEHCTTSSDLNHSCSITRPNIMCKGGPIKLSNYNNDSSAHTTGMLEIFHDGQWGTLDTRSITTQTAQSLCNLLGLGRKGFGMHFTTTTQWRWLSSMDCVGNISDIEECTHSDWEYFVHPNSYSIGLFCSDINVTGLRLVGGAGSHEGRVEIKINETWGTISGGPYCGSFALSAAHVLCRMMNYSAAKAYYTYFYNSGYYYGTPYGAGTGPFYFNYLACDVNATHLTECDLTYMPKVCEDHQYDIAITCLRDYDVQLTGTTGRSGPPMVHSKGKWQYICPTDVTYALANVTCNSLGFSGVLRLNHSNVYIGTPVFEMRLDCSGQESNLSQCVHTKRVSCSNLSSVEIECTEHSVSAVRLQGGKEFKGVVEVEINGRNGTFCIVDFSTNEANAVCQTIGYLRSTSYYSNKASNQIQYRSNENTSVIISMQCQAQTSNISQCKLTVIDASSSFCSQFHDVALECQRDCLMFEASRDKVGGKLYIYRATSNMDIDQCKELCMLENNCIEASFLGNGKICVLYNTNLNPGDMAKKTNIHDVHMKKDCHRGYCGLDLCLHGGECKNLAGGYICSCVPGYTGNNCEIDINECALVMCENGGTCINEVNKYTCKCQQGFRGIHCEQELLGASCAENKTICYEIPHGICNASKCVCQTGFEQNAAFRCVPKASIGTQCQHDEACLTEGAKCVTGMCKCTETNFYDPVSNACDAMPLFPYGSKENDLVMRKVDDNCTEAIKILPGMPVFDNMHTVLHVCTNGIVSFDYAFEDNWPRQTMQTTKDRTLLAPFFADITTMTSGNIYYRTYDILNNRSAFEGSIGKEIRQHIMLFAKIEKFNDVNFILIATWDRVRAYQKIFNSTSEATFQLVLATDGINTFALYIYGHKLMKWTVQGHQKKVDVLSGYFAKNHFKRNMYSFKTKILRIDTNSVIQGVSGVVLHKLTSAKSVRIVNNVAKCLNWFNENSHKETENEIYSSKILPKCPCNLEQLKYDPWFPPPTDNGSNITCVDVWPSQKWLNYSNTCCYNRTNGLWLYDTYSGGGLQMYHPFTNFIEHSRNDITPMDDCCKKSQLCFLYSCLHPIEKCYNKFWFTMAMFWGDPHIRTLDGKMFTFNGLGEYTMLSIKHSNIAFDLQARTERLLKVDGTLSYATIFSAFAARDSSNASVHVELNTNKDGMVVYGNGIDRTLAFADKSNNFHFVHDNLVLNRQSDSLMALFLHEEISLNISLGVKMLTINVIVPLSSQNITSGLLGNFDGNPDNDFITPDGIVKPSNMSDREVFNFGQLWSVTANTSVFRYTTGKSHAYYHNESFIPRFLSEFNNTAKRAEAINFCHGTENIACIYDFIFTGDKDVATHTLMSDLNAKNALNVIEMEVPDITGCGVLRITVGQNVSCKITSTSNKTFEKLQFIENSVDAKVYPSTPSNTYYIQYVQNTTDPVTIRFTAVNKFGQQSPAVTISIMLCTGCSSHGNCTGKPRYDQRNTEYFTYDTCVCTSSYQGDDCKGDLDGCASVPCSFGRNCTDVPAKIQSTSGQAYTCGDCQHGYIEDREGKCIDVDECMNSTLACSQVCDNTDGAYLCMCYNGYRIDQRNKTECKDINECEEGTHNCSQVCNNFLGGYNCSCYDGYDYNKTSGKCQLANLVLCQDSALNCSMAHGCRQGIDGKHLCFCEEGFELTANNNSCKDINECDRNICPQMCTNFDGGFNCTCYNGYMPTESNTCEECTFPMWGRNCENICQCNGRGGSECDKTRGCICLEGWSGETCDDDINECETLADPCENPRKVCQNLLGSIRCRCGHGYAESYNGTCVDINECSNHALNNCTQECHNTIGGYLCGCFHGYIYQNYSCHDINECEKGIAKCEQICENTPGGYNCHCQFAYELNEDRQTCAKMKDPCLQLRNLTCEHYCITYDKNVTCGCRQGYKLQKNEGTCSDVNECNSAELNQCSNNSFCQNNNGSYTCICPLGFKLENDARTCTACDRYHFGQNCSSTCDCLHGYNDKISGCKCNTGWTGDNCDKDIDECQDNSYQCTEAKTECINTPGGFKCNCLQGYTNATGSCKDIDECQNSTLNNCVQTCNNTPGSYKCGCEAGFKFASGQCDDIDECIVNVVCAQQCDNTIGGFRCSCNEGFKLNLVDRRTCIPKEQCNQTANAQCTAQNATCFEKDGKPNCLCAKGFQFNQTKAACVDISECEQIPKTCSQKCTEMEGSFRCSCDNGWKLQNDNTSCEVCIDNFFGYNCNLTCPCVAKNTKSCNPVNGTCICHNGWNGTKCELDVDECSNPDRWKCPDNSKCNNTVGGFKCECMAGYQKTAGGNCQTCKFGYYGNSCTSKCTCNVANTITCEPANGKCVCKDGWDGTTCSDNIDECLNISACPEHSGCRDTNGSYVCECNSGFFETPNKTCSACAENTYGIHCDMKCDCHDNNTLNRNHMCNNVTGVCICNPAWRGDHCEIDFDECTNSNICEAQLNAGCHNFAGGFICDCLRGFERDGNGACTRNKTTVTDIFDKPRVDLTVTLNVSLPSSTNLNVTSTYTQIAKMVTEVLTNFYQRLAVESVAIIVKNLRQGSIIADVIVITDNKNAGETLREGAQRLSEGVVIIYNGMSIRATAKSDFQIVQDCKCPDGSFCGDNGPSTCRSVDNAGDNIWKYVAIAIAVTLVITVIASVIVCIRLKKRNNKIAIDTKEKHVQKVSAMKIDDADLNQDNWYEMTINMLPEKQMAPNNTLFKNTVSSKLLVSNALVELSKPKTFRNKDKDESY